MAKRYYSNKKYYLFITREYHIIIHHEDPSVVYSYSVKNIKLNSVDTENIEREKSNENVVLSLCIATKKDRSIRFHLHFADT